MLKPEPEMTLLAIDDDVRSLALIAATLEQDGLEILTCEDPEKALAIVRKRLPRIVICDLVMPKLNGMQVLHEITNIDPTIDVILLTGHYSAETAVEAIREGAYDYLTKPIAPERLRARVDELIAEGNRVYRAGVLDDELIETHQFHGMIGRAPAMLDVFARIRRIAPHYRTVLITGATGTGKELAARALHDLSPVATGPFAVCNCAALPDALIESELFGYTRGAFTGATQDKPGLFEHANNGTLLLDEIREMPISAQAKLLRAIQHQELQRIGSPIPKKINVRVIASTHRNLQSMVAEQKFREDLLYRLRMVQLHLPPLSERREDLPLLIRHFISVFSKQYDKKLSGLTRRAENLLMQHSWPGSVRELEGAIGSAAMMAERPLIDVGDLPEEFQGSDAASVRDGEPEELLISLEEAQTRHALRVIQELGGDKAPPPKCLASAAPPSTASFRKLPDGASALPIRML